MSSDNSSQSNDVDNIQRDIDIWKGRLTLVAIGLFVLYAMAFFTLKDFPKSLDAEKWGQFGDFIGGLMNPLVAFAAFYWLTRSVKLQKQELAATRAELSAANATQKELVNNGKKSIRLAALTALSSAIDGEIRVLNDRISLLDSKLVESSSNLYGMSRAYEKMVEERNGFVARAVFLEDERQALATEIRMLLKLETPD